MAAVSGDSQRLILPADVRQRGGETGKQRLRLPTKNVGNGRTDAAIRDVHDVEIGCDLELLHREMRKRTRTGGTIGKLAGIGFHIGDEFFSVLTGTEGGTSGCSACRRSWRSA